jgi:hypothetical protein
MQHTRLEKAWRRFCSLQGSEMEIFTILDHIDSGHMALQEFQYGYVRDGDQRRKLLWATESKADAHGGDGALAASIVKLLLEGQQHMTSVYGVARGRPERKAA